MHKVRLVLKTRETYRSFWWFGMEGDDFYFGPSNQIKMYSSIPSNGEKQLSLTVPQNKEDFEPENLKASFHESGQFHIKIFGTTTPDSRMEDKKNWIRKEEITKPLRFLTAISKIATEYPEYKNSLTRKKASAIVIALNNEQSFYRHYFEFYLAPEGTHEFPPPLLSMPMPFKGHVITHSMNAALILVIRHAAISPLSPLTTWQPDVEIDFYGIDATPSVSTDPIGTA